MKSLSYGLSKDNGLKIETSRGESQDRLREGTRRLIRGATGNQKNARKKEPGEGMVVP